MRQPPEQAGPSRRSVSGRAALPIIGIIFIVIGLASLVVSGILVYGESTSPRTAAVSGSVVDASRYPVVQFSTADGNIIRFTNFVRSSLWHAGDAVTVIYDPANPQDAVIGGFMGRWFTATLAGALGGVFLLLGILFTVMGRSLAWRKMGR
jgi:Protein of unknown function (DUF3592)